MIRVYRIVKPRYEASAWTGEGASKNGGRWNHPGTPCVYCGGSLALTSLEMLVHLESADVLQAYRVAWIDVDPAQVRDTPVAILPADWDAEPATNASRDFGTAWLAARQTVALRVPSVILPAEHNILLNPRHPDFAALARSAFQPFNFDPRLLKD
ncbi:RES family NAD+ phosphorylase [Humisphaera borealis]|uniref:RES domain-containing protein n=1 Tax=Humisphaera borealis TaxID=2807512 RepID=A0A7M2WZH6_9BACT|nr:RES family NAD+ phosphorylase [Humisphaera borealis]QOV89890.1 RES domain-containing protein [Humisphaera borealis]